MPFQVGHTEALRDYGFGTGGKFGLVFYDGWETRGSATFFPHTSVNHHTAGSPTGVFPSAYTLVFGRGTPGQPGYLPGPLCNHGLDRAATLHVIAAGRANHAGLGGWATYSGNSTCWGLEVEHTGLSSEPVTDRQWEAMYAYHAAVAEYSGFAPANVCQHFEWAPSRKQDFLKTVTDPHHFRNMVDQTEHYTEGDWFDMATEAQLEAVVNKCLSNFERLPVVWAGSDRPTHWYMVWAGVRVLIDQNQANALQANSLLEWSGAKAGSPGLGQAAVVDQHIMDSFVTMGSDFYPTEEGYPGQVERHQHMTDE